MSELDIVLPRAFEPDDEDSIRFREYLIAESAYIRTRLDLIRSV